MVVDMDENELAKQYPDLYQKWWNYGYEAGKRLKREAFIKEKMDEIEELEARANAVDAFQLQKKIAHLQAEKNDILKQFRDYKNKIAKKQRGRNGFKRQFIQQRKNAFLKGFCIYCGADAYTIDHMIPISRGGTNRPENRIPACQSCNNEKGNMTYDEYMIWRKYHRPF